MTLPHSMTFDPGKCDCQICINPSEPCLYWRLDVECDECGIKIPRSISHECDECGFIFCGDCIRDYWPCHEIHPDDVAQRIDPYGPDTLEESWL